MTNYELRKLLIPFGQVKYPLPVCNLIDVYSATFRQNILFWSRINSFPSDSAKGAQF